jgi:UDP-N-acetylglucosamine acyltransferase
MTRIHPTAIIDPHAELHETVEVGPYVVIEGGVRIGKGTRILAHAYINGETTIGEDNVIHMGATIGHEPQDISYDGSPRRLEIGDRNVFREHVSIHRASKPDKITRVGSDCFLMVGSHVAHDCQVGNHVIMANNALLGGHSVVGDRANLSGGCAVHQFCRVGRLAMIQGCTPMTKDLPPFMIASGLNQVRGLNVIGMRRAGFSAAARSEVKAAFRILYTEGNSLSTSIAKLEAGNFGPEVAELILFLKESKRGVCLRFSGAALHDED